MKPARLLVAAIVTCLVLQISLAYATSNDTHLEQVQTLFRLTQMEKKINEGVDSIMQLQLGQNPRLEQHRKEIRGFFEKHIGWEAMKNDIADMYMKTFSEDELRAINAFYITPTGQKVINALPDLVQQRNQLAMQRLQQNIGELKQIIAEPVTGP